MALILMIARLFLVLVLLLSFAQSVKAHDSRRLNIPESFINMFLQNQQEYEYLCQQLFFLIWDELGQELGHSLGEHIVVNYFQLDLNQIEADFEVDPDSLIPQNLEDLMQQIIYRLIGLGVDFTSEEVINPLHFFAVQLSEFITPIISLYLIEPLVNGLSDLTEAQQAGVVAPLFQRIIPRQISRLIIKALPCIIILYILNHNRVCY